MSTNGDDPYRRRNGDDPYRRPRVRSMSERRAALPPERRAGFDEWARVTNGGPNIGEDIGGWFLVVTVGGGLGLAALWVLRGFTLALAEVVT